MHWTRSLQFSFEQAQFGVKGRTKTPCSFLLVVFLAFNLFGRSVEPSEVKGNTHEIPLAFSCVQSVHKGLAKAHDTLGDAKDRLHSALARSIDGFPR